MNTRAYAIGSVLGILGILVAGGLVYTSIGNHHTALTTAGAQNTEVTKVTNQTTSNSISNQASIPLPTKPVSSTDKSTIKLLKEQTRFKAVLPSYLPKGYGGNYSAELDNFSKNHKPNHQAVNLFYKKTNTQYFKVIEFPDPNTQIPTGPSNKFKKITINGTEVNVFSPSSNDVLQQYRFLKNGMLFQIISFGNNPGDTMKFVKSLIDGGTPWN